MRITTWILLAGLLGGAFEGGALLTAAELVDVRQSPHAAIRSVGLDEVKWTDGFWADRFETCANRSLPAMWDIMRSTKYKPYLEHFLIAAGQTQGDYHGAQWNDGDFYKFLESACAVMAVTHDPKLEAIVDQSIAAIAAAQRDDGYIHTPVLIRIRNGDTTARPFEDRHNFEMYNMGHLMTAACVHHRVTGREDFLNVAKRAADFLYDTFRNPTPQLAQNSVCPAHYMGTVELYRTTRDPRYLELAQTFLDMRNLVEGGDDNQDRIPFVEQREVVGHAVRANYLYAGAADLYAETGDAELWEPLEAIWDNLVSRKLYLTGGCGALYDGASPDMSEDQLHITRIHQAYGRNYQLPNLTAHNETCAAIGNVLWNWRMFLVDGDARFIDVTELSLYNAILSGVSLDGTSYFYVNPLRNLATLPTEMRWPRERVNYMTSFCCPPNVVRTVAEVGNYAYAKSADAVWVNLYGGNTLSTDLQSGRVALRQVTNYPWEGSIRLTVEACPQGEFALNLRIPGWVVEPASIKVNGDSVSAVAKPGSFFEIRRQWRAGDVVELELPMPTTIVESHPQVEETRQQVALKRGPVVYCLESPDLPPGVAVNDVVVPRDLKPEVTFDSGLLDGVAALDANVLVRSTAPWNNELYRPIAETDERRVDVRFVPYYAWANRGKSEMSVWLPVN